MIVYQVRCSNYSENTGWTEGIYLNKEVADTRYQELTKEFEGMDIYVSMVEVKVIE